MATIYEADSNAYQQLGPGQNYERIREGEKVAWNWPMIPDGEKPTGDNRRPPPRWILRHTEGAGETANRLAQPGPEGNLDAQRQGGEAQEKAEAAAAAPAQRGRNAADQQLVTDAVNGLSDVDASQWTALKLPQVEAVREAVEKEIGRYPHWVNRKMIEKVGRTRQQNPGS